MVPGRVTSLTAGPRWRLASATVGMACLSVHCATCAVLWARRTMPFAATAPANARAARPISRMRRRFGVLMGSKDMVVSKRSGAVWERGAGRRRLGLFALAATHKAEHGRYEEQRGAGGKYQPADHCTAKRRVLPGFNGHRHHANDHSERRHQHRSYAGAARL